VITLTALYISLRGQGMRLEEYRRFMRFNWYRSLSSSGAIQKHTEMQTFHTIRAVPHEFMCWVQSCGFWTQREIDEVSGLILKDMMED